MSKYGGVGNKNQISWPLYLWDQGIKNNSLVVWIISIALEACGWVPQEGELGAEGLRLSPCIRTWFMAWIKFMFLSGSGFEQKQWQPAKSKVQNGHAAYEYVALASGKQALVRSCKPPPSAPPVTPTPTLPPPPTPPPAYFEVYQMFLVLQLDGVSRNKNSQLSVVDGTFDFASPTSCLPSTLPEMRAMGKTWEIPMLAGWPTGTHWFLNNTGVACLAVLFLFLFFFFLFFFEYTKGCFWISKSQ